MFGDRGDKVLGREEKQQRCYHLRQHILLDIIEAKIASSYLNLIKNYFFENILNSR